MRRRRSHNGLSVRAISGTYVVILGIDMDAADCDGLLGFAIHRTDHTEDEAYWMRGIKTFAETDPGFVAGSTYSTPPASYSVLQLVGLFGETRSRLCVPRRSNVRFTGRSQVASSGTSSDFHRVARRRQP